MSTGLAAVLRVSACVNWQPLIEFLVSVGYGLLSSLGAARPPAGPVHEPHGSEGVDLYLESGS